MPRIQGCACVCVRVHTRVCLQLTVSLYFFLLSLCPVFLCVCLSSSLSIHASAFLGPPGLSNFPFAALTFPLISLLSPPSLPAPRSPSYSSHNHWVTLLHLRPSFLFLLSSFPIPSLCLAFISLYSISLFSPSSRPPFLFSSAAPPSPFIIHPHRLLLSHLPFVAVCKGWQCPWWVVDHTHRRSESNQTATELH